MTNLPTQGIVKKSGCIKGNCSEVADGNTHQHHDLPILVAGNGGGTIRTGRFLDLGFRSHGDLWTGLAQAMGSNIQNFGSSNGGAIYLN